MDEPMTSQFCASFSDGVSPKRARIHWEASLSNVSEQVFSFGPESFSHSSSQEPIARRPLEVRPAIFSGEKRSELSSSIKIRFPYNGTDSAGKTYSRRVLIVDDDPSVAETIAMVLSSIGHRGVKCNHPDDALKILKSESFDLLITDFRMPDISGLELVRRLRNDQCPIPVLLITAYLPDVDSATLWQLGVIALLEKPFNLQSFQQALAKFTGGGEEEAGGFPSNVSSEPVYMPGDKIMLRTTGEVFTVQIDTSDRSQPGIFVKEPIGRPLQQYEVKPAGKTRLRILGEGN